MTGRAKWDAWNKAGSFYFSNEDAEAKYLDIARSMGWTEDTVITKPEPEPVDEDEDGIWDDDEDSSHSNTSKRGGSSGGFGLAVSQVSQPEQEDDDGSVHYLAVSNKAARLQALLETQAEVIDTRDEYVRVLNIPKGLASLWVYRATHRCNWLQTEGMSMQCESCWPMAQIEC